MTQQLPALKFKTLKQYADWKLLLLLLLFLNVKLAIKIPAIALIYLLQFDFRFGFRFKDPRLPLFYPLIIVIAIAGFIINGKYTDADYNLVFITGIGFWLLCILAVHQVKLSVERNTTAVVHQTILVFFIINIIASLLNLAFIVLETHAFNPYTYQGQYQKYFISTGDFVKGITFDTSTTNAVLNAFGVIYFLIKKNMGMTLACMAILLLTGSNFTNVFILAVLAFLFVFNSTRDQKSVIIICVCFLVLFMAKISPQNNNYVMNTVKTAFYGREIISPWPKSQIPVTQRPDSTLNPEEKREKIATLYLDSIAALPINQVQREKLPPGVPVTATGRVVLPQADVNSPSYQWLRTTPPEQKQLVDFVNTHEADLPVSRTRKLSLVPGKVMGLLQTFNFYKHHPAKILTGDGVGNFSSKLAFRATGLKFTGGYPQKYIYINPDFLSNHLDVYLSFFSQSAATHSLTNSPFSVYDQLLAEYGLLGLLALFIFYLGFFAKHYATLTYGIPAILLVMFLFFIDYWFEQLSIIIFFELLLFLNIKEGKELLTAKSTTAK
ncbi:hypothetical protein FO440_05055 [Mucilaginibacter corticis]|uniref:O-antigen ligase family protein n=1 Tax=Mucilaginibacter corticis TaxID=2597670 RepID=A0A556MUF0_9SPHI|nr:hypothetical protein [Mucilaginibacter corticis]TSJ43560.1 hypothetical protein FO440_05055 [Mucilaginibacter corticis]